MPRGLRDLAVTALRPVARSIGVLRRTGLKLESEMAMSGGSAKNQALPLCLEQIDAAWFSNVLSEKWPGISIATVTPIETFDGTTTVVRFKLESDRTDVPSTMCLKGGFNENSRFNPHALLREARFYKWAGDQPGLSIPGCFYADFSKQAGQGIVLLEDLVGARASFLTPAEGLTVEEVGAMLGVLANLHARSWGTLPLDASEVPGGTLKMDGIGKRLMSEESWKGAMRKGRASALAGPLRDRDFVWNLLRQAYRSNYFVGSYCLLHGDPHPGNIFKRADSNIGLYDWQRSMHGPWVHDIAYLVAGGLAVTDRRACERDLLSFYLARLKAHGAPAPAMGPAFEAYRREVVQPLMWVVTPAGTQSEEAIEAMTTRFAAAVIDLDAIAAISAAS